MTDTQREREALTRRMMGVPDVDPVPRLWCPPITHYTGQGTVDVGRMATHWRTMTPYVGGFWSPAPRARHGRCTRGGLPLVETAIELATELDTRLLVGVLRTDVEAMHAVIDETCRALKTATGETDPLAAMAKRNVAGFTVCPPRGAGLSQAQIGAGLESILDLGLPVALYQLPQITQYQVAPETFAHLASVTRTCCSSKTRVDTIGYQWLIRVRAGSSWSAGPRAATPDGLRRREDVTGGCC